MLLVLVSWVIFAFEDLGQIGIYLSTMFNLNGSSFANSETIYYLQNYIVIIIIGIICSIPLIQIIKNRKKIAKEHRIANKENKEKINREKNVNKGQKGIAFAILTSVGYVAIMVLSTASLVNNSFNPFLYFRF